MSRPGEAVYLARGVQADDQRYPRLQWGENMVFLQTPQSYFCPSQRARLDIIKTLAHGSMSSLDMSPHGDFTDREWGTA